LILHGDCLLKLKELEPNSVDAIVTDPPYGLKFMGKKWDTSVPSVELWRECLRVLKPGGHVLSFGGTRTYHHMAMNIELAGFEIRDQLQWIYGSGFPKSTNVALRIDKEAGAIGNRGKGFNAAGQGISLNQNKELRSDHPEYVPPEFKTDAAKEWQGWGTALKPANEPIVLARKPLSEKTVAENVLRWGTGAINVDAGRIAASIEDIKRTNRLNHKGNFDWKHSENTAFKMGQGADISQGRWPSNLLLDEDAAKMLDAQSGVSKSTGGKGRATQKATLSFGGGERVGGYEPRLRANAGGLGDSGGASRFFYVAKASKHERGEGNAHPTVKPIKLMQYLIKLITPPKGTVLDPFMGSGSTGVAAKSLGFEFIGIELEPQYAQIAERRIEATA
jgi:DNA modification methylase